MVDAVKLRSIAALAVVLLVAGTAGATPPFDAEQVTDLVLSRILRELAITSDYVAFVHPRLLDGDDKLAPYAPTPIPAFVDHVPYLIPYDLAAPTWSVWIDLQPPARYAHDTLFVLINAAEGAYTVYPETWWPVLNGTSLWVEQADYWNEENWIASSLSAGIPIGESAATCEPDLPVFGVIFGVRS